ncbi:hypothetical protein RclHR1_01180001 [Rhizophagus clarus]|uniref:Uncharacterized protein n=1 Tax=Rhizophagus clarus TaxID=94130 RepID=A0A2Z6QKD6_9GLOM|nr:hypothetical protein RclHR1_01180001 [Rhizophagus clarus]GES79558.1 hypothetical protein RCL_e21232_RclHR1_01180001 [Rhizophagus clarus]
MEPPMSEALDSLKALVSQNHAKANKLRNDLKKCCKLLSKLITDLPIVSEPATYAQLITNVATLSRMILDGSFSLAEFHQQIITDELHLSMWTRDPDLSSNLHEVAPADSVMIKPIVKYLPRLKVFLPKKHQKHRQKNFHYHLHLLFLCSILLRDKEISNLRPMRLCALLGLNSYWIILFRIRIFASRYF